MSSDDRTTAWWWFGTAAVSILVELAVYALWRGWFVLVTGGHWLPIVISAYYFGRASKKSLTCQDHGDEFSSWPTSDGHLHECGRERGHRSRVHRCKCSCEWWKQSIAQGAP